MTAGHLARSATAALVAATLVIACSAFGSSSDDPPKAPPPAVPSADGAAPLDGSDVPLRPGQDAGVDGTNGCTEIVETFEGPWSEAPNWEKVKEGAETAFTTLDDDGRNGSHGLNFGSDSAANTVLFQRNITPRCSVRFETWIDIPDNDAIDNVTIFKLTRNGGAPIEIVLGGGQINLTEGTTAYAAFSYAAATWVPITFTYDAATGTSTLERAGSHVSNPGSSAARVQFGIVHFNSAAPRFVLDDLRLVF